ncbi:hypothetical protein TUBRATIS_13890 [Tubulinosema ratisbonensis]|uniref:Uncharacterized protein n=1 Tax=Tubulinosema ratisbonensis TaxID=291195 RepID=A0A437AM24_9MICR|nr:hypothetical protein TUBRATIS_13890 [Tubulinosema ratisbonensis]
MKETFSKFQNLIQKDELLNIISRDIQLIDSNVSHMLVCVNNLKSKEKSKKDLENLMILEDAFAKLFDQLGLDLSKISVLYDKTKEQINDLKDNLEQIRNDISEFNFTSKHYKDDVDKLECHVINLQDRMRILKQIIFSY